ncbi:hypothetical protein PVAR5_8187 [Paecilomyces variotii No. 5]|uniref:Uncharacterized protein n=1 Tax=Byssochlamys spectabilis (strain No. 5 / NBRC 109023) TaxID=1356009 RepID=V5GEU4_BYSSN|nr:hypothetical protein PVAR5_8187 [Paecilomyces variotii No. 5]
MDNQNRCFEVRSHLPTSSGLEVFSGPFSSFELRRSAGEGDRFAISSSESAILCRFSVGTDTEEVLRRLRAAGAYLSMDRRLFLSVSLLGVRLRLRERSRRGLALTVRVRPRLRLLLLLRLGLRRLRSRDRSLLRLKRRASGDLRRFPTSRLPLPPGPRELDRERATDLVRDPDLDLDTDERFLRRLSLGGGDLETLREVVDRSLLRSRLGERE